LFRKTVSAIMLSLLVISMLTLAFKIQIVKADDGTIYINSDGSITPSTAPIYTADNVTYTFATDIGFPTYSGLMVQRSNIIVNGNGHTLIGSGTSQGTGLWIDYGTGDLIENMTISNFADAIYVLGDDNTISGDNITRNSYGLEAGYSSNIAVNGNNLTQNGCGVFLGSSSGSCVGENSILNGGTGIAMFGGSCNNNVSDNDVENCACGIFIDGNPFNAPCYRNSIYHNNLINNTNEASGSNLSNFWDDGYPSGGNYWSDYRARYPNASEIDSSGIWNTPYAIVSTQGFGCNNTDRFPLVNPRPSASTTMYTVTFNETGLPPDVLWYVTLDGVGNSSKTESITFVEPNGVHGFTVEPVSDYSCSPSSGNVTINGDDVTVDIVFQPQLTGNLILGDNFQIDTELNTVLWRVNSPMLHSIADFESSAFTEGVSVGYPNLPMDFSGQGLDWGMTGNGAMSGITSNLVFTPPYVIEVNASISSMSGGNPVAIFLTNNDTSSLIALFVSNRIWVQVGSNLPSHIYDNVQFDTIYTFKINVTLSSLEVSVLEGTQELAYYPLSLSALTDYGYYLTLGCFAGRFEGEGPLNSPTVGSCLASVEATSEDTWNLTVSVNDVTSQPLQNVNVVVTNLFGNINYTANTGAEGTSLFTELVSGFYTVCAQVSQGGNVITNEVNVSIGDNSNPSQEELSASLPLSIPPPPPLSVYLWLSRDPVGLPPIDETFAAVPCGWVGNYTWTWDINGTIIPGDEVYDRVFSVPGSTYEVNATVKSEGTWYGNPKGAESSISGNIMVDVNDTPFLASVIPTANLNYIPITYNGFSNEAVMYIDQGKVFIANATVTDIYPVRIPLPDWLSSLLGMEDAFQGVALSDNAGSVDTGQIIQPESDIALINQSLPTGTPTEITSLIGYKFNVIIDPYAKWALMSDLVTAVMGAIGFLGEFKEDVPAPLLTKVIDAVVGAVEGSLQESVYRFGLDLDMNTNNIIGCLSSHMQEFLELVKSVLQTLVASSSPILRELIPDSLYPGQAEKIIDAIGPIVVDALADLAGVGIFKAVADFTVDFAAIFATLAKGQITQEYKISSLTPMSSFTVQGHSPAPYVTVQNGAETYGYNGSWVSSTSNFVFSDYTTDEYSFAIEDPASVRMIVQTPPGESSSAYDIMLYHNGTDANISGDVTAGKPQAYTITYGSDYINVTAASFVWSPSVPAVNDAITFNGSSSTAGQGTIGSYAWSFGDGQTGSGPIVTHTYSTPGNYTVTLNVTDTQGDCGIQQQEIQVFQGGQYNITFSQTGVGSDFKGTIITIDGTSYSTSELPLSFLWDEGSSHSFSFASALNVNASRGYFWWSTSGLSSLKNDTLTVTTSGNITATFGLIGDLNHDGRVSLTDLVLFSAAWRSHPGDTNWNSECDIAPPYGVISLSDLVTLAMHYGQHYP